jgi:hypothetical protein
MPVKNKPKKTVIIETFTVIRQFTLDKVYYVGDSVQLSKKEQIEQLLIQKYIK